MKLKCGKIYENRVGDHVEIYDISPGDDICYYFGKVIKDVSKLTKPGHCYRFSLGGRFADYTENYDERIDLVKEVNKERGDCAFLTLTTYPADARRAVLENYEKNIDDIEYIFAGGEMTDWNVWHSFFEIASMENPGVIIILDGTSYDYNEIWRCAWRDGKEIIDWTATRPLVDQEIINQAEKLSKHFKIQKILLKLADEEVELLGLER